MRSENLNKKQRLEDALLTHNWRFIGEDGDLDLYQRGPEIIGVDEVGLFYYLEGVRLGGMSWTSFKIEYFRTGEIPLPKVANSIGRKIFFKEGGQYGSV